MNAKTINQVLAEMDELPETMSVYSLVRSSAARNRNDVSRPCTVDGITIYPSIGALANALGHGKEGANHPNLRFTDGLPRDTKTKPNLSTEHKAAIGHGQLGRDGGGSMPCTIDDGITIYRSLKILSDTLGHGKTGKTHPNLKFLSPEEAKIWKKTRENEVTPVQVAVKPKRLKRNRPTQYNALCTIDDGITVYAKLTDLYAVHGQGNAGRKNPNLRFLTTDEIEVWKNGHKETE
jgi:hypothetical protein